MKEQGPTAILLIHCADKCGIVAAVTEFLSKNNGNILHLDQHVDYQGMVFFMRVHWELDGFAIPPDKIGEYFHNLIAKKFEMKWKLYFGNQRPRAAVFVSKLPHCLFDILARVQSGEWNLEIPLIISNHPHLENVAEKFGIDFKVFPINETNKIEQEEKQLALLQENKIDFIILARYMQILSEDFVSHFPDKIINIHHSFLPAFPGAKPYHSAHERGVKIIGATSHYVTATLDDGPIIEQDVVRVSHKDDIKDLIRKGRDLEKIVLARAVWLHLMRKTLVYANRCIIFF
ncbi:formyltetrahydrofolate deformylase [Candidatus Riflebacteria bacterium]